MERKKGIYIMQLDGKDAYLANYSSAENNTGYTTQNKDGVYNLKKFKAAFDYSLDLLQLRFVYKTVYRNNRFSFWENKKEFSPCLINVSFRYAVKAYNRTAANIYLKYGHALSMEKIEDCVHIENGTLIAVMVDTPVKKPVDSHILGRYFYWEHGVYKAKKNITTLVSVADIRRQLYQKGFICNGIHYVRWKRSSGSARVGKCLFIDERLYPKMHKWETAGLHIPPGTPIDLAALESYIALTASSMIDTIKILPENILVIEDYMSVFFDDVIRVQEANGCLKAADCKSKITNSIWDGQSLIDPSLMGRYKSKGMLLLRNRLFKSCCFNTNIQRWFADHGITQVRQLNGFTLAQDISDIKLITTPSSIKYLKFGTLQQWFKHLLPDFGIVKFEKPPHFLDGTATQTHYQLINSLQLSKEEVAQLLQPTFSFLDLLKKDPAVLRWWIKVYPQENFADAGIKSKSEIIYRLLGSNEAFSKTKLYDDFRADFLKAFIKHLKEGRVLVNGCYATLCGNPIEMLQAAIGKFSGKPQTPPGTLYCKRFEDGQLLLGSRSPHITFSNILLAKNTVNLLINRYINATEEIVFINSINENILQKLAGCDFDSDAILLTDNTVLIRAAMRNKDRFKVAVCDVAGIKNKRRYLPEEQADLDIQTSKNLIGDIVNLSQELNTLVWDMLADGKTFTDIQDIYMDICKLSVASGIEIDKAKKEFLVDNSRELASIRKKYAKEKDHKQIKPNFFAHLAKRKGYYNAAKKAYIKHKTAMDYLQSCIHAYRCTKKGKAVKKEFLPFSEILDHSGFSSKRVYYKQIKETLEDVYQTNQAVSAVFADKHKTTEEKFGEVFSLRECCALRLGKKQFNRDTMLTLLKSIEKEENKKYRRFIFYTLFSFPNNSFFSVLKESRTPCKTLKKDCNGSIEILGCRYSHTDLPMQKQDVFFDEFSNKP
ncbi:MAG TPA: hypothetical protein IAD32_01505 [Candidatus Scatavimonas merdigallinarum]|uniref:Uncharacterized protein n=1 Tax=Candidatus Scatavimonas merdigallinarum TaxID=2840914 RepID=A0A9D0ZGM2_9FIRM|nr:hypothetical protein [Candidatus Scatavimonas merdigallinarum]